MQALIPILIALLGLFTITGAALDWDWFIANRKVRVFVALFGRTGARVFYVVLGTVLVAYAVYVLVNLLR